MTNDILTIQSLNHIFVDYAQLDSQSSKLVSTQIGVNAVNTLGIHMNGCWEQSAYTNASAAKEHSMLAYLIHAFEGFTPGFHIQFKYAQLFASLWVFFPVDINLILQLTFW